VPCLALESDFLDFEVIVLNVCDEFDEFGLVFEARDVLR
jgi:hypothetical protein